MEIIELEPARPEVSATRRRGLGTSIPMSVLLQVSPGLILQPIGGLMPVALSGGVRLLAGANTGLLRFFQLGAGVDVDYQAVSTDLGAPLARVRWQTTQARVRVEGAADVARFDVLELGEAHVALLAGAGVVAGTHWLSVGGRATPELLLGPTIRAGVSGGFTLGPGSITVAVPLDWSVDVVGPVQNYAPLAASLYLGYRLEL